MKRATSRVKVLTEVCADLNSRLVWPYYRQTRRNFQYNQHIALGFRSSKTVASRSLIVVLQDS
jgi:DNA-binding transcriptional regulator YdaS (Cro superfamily)